ncbi:BT_3987 domain-containing protein [Gaoshiqia sp. Z1-71]|uniref:BT_3987 domain-containing protein n=1 Tax=Gaoshiqia hydrogeniformans TaxID=3290090 RepID=UPI003BF849E0
MKKILNLKYIVISVAVFGAFLFQSCSEDETFDVTGATENKVYINTYAWSPANTPKNTFMYKVTNTPIGSIIANTDQIEVKFGVQCTHVAPENLRVKFETDQSLISEGYMALPNGVTLSMDKTELIIPKGTTKSADSITLSIDSDKLNLLAVATYMVPVKIASVSNGNSAVSSNLNAVYLMIETTESNCYNFSVANDMTGALITSKTGWTGTVNAPLVSGTPANMLNTMTSSYWRVNPQVFDWSVDMVSERTNITGIRIHTNNAAYNFTKLKVFSSTDGVSWTSQGITELTIGNAYQYIKFYEPINARYLKFEVLGWRSTTQIRVALFDVYIAI